MHGLTPDINNPMIETNPFESLVVLAVALLIAFIGYNLWRRYKLKQKG